MREKIKPFTGVTILKFLVHVQRKYISKNHNFQWSLLLSNIIGSCVWNVNVCVMSLFSMIIYNCNDQNGSRYLEIKNSKSWTNKDMTFEIPKSSFLSTYDFAKNILRSTSTNKIWIRFNLGPTHTKGTLFETEFGSNRSSDEESTW